VRNRHENTLIPSWKFE